MRIVIASIAAIAVAGCGFKGPLYLPKPEAAAVKPAPAVDRAPDRPAPSQSTPGPK